MTFHMYVRSGHRWLGMTLTLAVLANFLAMAFGEPPLWLVYFPLAPLALLLISGMYLFVLPYGTRRRRDPATS